jgi:hypothetical protein
MKDCAQPIRIAVFDRSAACACRPGEQRGLMLLKGILHGIRKEYGAQVAISYHAYDQQPEEFHRNPDITDLIRTGGLEALPVTVVNGAIQKRGAHPTLQELRSFIAATQ